MHLAWPLEPQGIDLHFQKLQVEKTYIGAYTEESERGDEDDVLKKTSRSRTCSFLWIRNECRYVEPDGIRSRSYDFKARHAKW
ncbi:hypothetical protein D3C84_1110940 [compost metagenome]